MQTVKFTDSCGQKRTGIKKSCEICSKEFITRVTRAETQKCCSSGCSSKLNSKLNRVQCKCAWCDTLFDRQKNKLHNSKSGLFFCNRKCKENAQKLGGITEIMPDHYGAGLYSNESLVKELKQENKNCVDCGENKYYLLCIHHIDSNRKNNTRENLEVVCFNCHAKRHLVLKDSVWVINFKTLTPREKLKEL